MEENDEKRNRTLYRGRLYASRVRSPSPNLAAAASQGDCSLLRWWLVGHPGACTFRAALGGVRSAVPGREPRGRYGSNRRRIRSEVPGRRLHAVLGHHPASLDRTVNTEGELRSVKGLRASLDFR